MARHDVRAALVRRPYKAITCRVVVVRHRSNIFIGGFAPCCLNQVPLQFYPAALISLATLSMPWHGIKPPHCGI